MNTATLTLVFVSSLAVLACKQPDLAAKDQIAIQQVLEDQQVAWNRGDIEAFMAGYAKSPDTVFTSGGQVRRGWHATIARYRERYTDRAAMGHLEFEITEVRGLGPEAAVVLGTWALTETPKAGGGVFSLVFERQGANWVIVHDHTSARTKD